MQNCIELTNLERGGYCILYKETGEKKYCSEKKLPFFTGLYFEDGNTFFSIYPTKQGPIIYYKRKEYQLNKNLHISLEEQDKTRVFFISEYDIKIKYAKSPYIGMDVWSNEEDVDLFYQITKYYKSDEYYKKFTI